jgi:hypothetical protein
MQRSGGGEVSREIIVSSRRPLIPVVRPLSLWMRQMSRRRWLQKAFGAFSIFLVSAITIFVIFML